MSEFTVDDLVNFAVQNDALNVKRALENIMSNKVDAAVEARREEVGVSLFGEPDDQEPDLEDETEGDDYSNEDNLEDIEEEEPDETDE